MNGIIGFLAGLGLMALVHLAIYNLFVSVVSVTVLHP